MAYFLGFRGDSSISLSQAVRDRTGQAAFLRDPRAGPSAQVGWRQVKVSSTFSKGRYVPVGRCPAADRGGSREVGCGGSWCPVGTLQDRPRRQPRPATAFPYSQKGGADVPLLGCHRDRSRGYRLRSRLPARSALNGAHRAPAPCAPSAAFLPPAAPVKAVELCSTPRKFFEKNLTKNFYLSLLFPSAGFWASVSQPAPAPLSAVRDSSRAATR